MLWRRPKFKFIVFGTGGAAKKHAEALKNRRGKLVACFNPSGSDLSGFRAPVIQNVEDLSSYDFDFGVIASPNSAHCSQIEFLLSMHKPVLVEKPIVASEIELDRLKSTKLPCNQFIMIATNLRHQRNSIQFKSLVSKAPEPVRHINIDWQRKIDRPIDSWSLNRDIAGGGVLLDWGAHTLDLLDFFLPQMNFVPHRAILHRGVDSVEHTANIELHSKCGVLCNMNLSWKTEKATNKELSVSFSYDNQELTWFKSGKLLVKNAQKITEIGEGNHCEMHDFFLEKFVKPTNQQSEKFNSFDISCKVFEQITKAYKIS